MGSRMLSLSTEDIWKIGKGFLIAAAGAALAYVVTDVVPLVSAQYGATVGALLSTAVNFALKFLTDTREAK